MSYGGSYGRGTSGIPSSPGTGGATPMPHYYQPNDQSCRDTGRSPGNSPPINNTNSNLEASSKTQPTNSDKSKYEELLDNEVMFGRDRFTIKAYIPCGKQRLFALECKRSMAGYDGRCPECQIRHINLDPSRGFYAPADAVLGALEQKKLENQRLMGRKPIDQLITIKDNLPPLNHPVIGTNKGIEGDSNSCYMDATIFCMFTYSNVFDSLLHMDIQKKSSKQLQKVLRENIVNVLRSDNGFVERDALYHLRSQLSEATGDASFKQMEKDPSEFLRALEEIFQYAPLKTIAPDQPPNENLSNITTNIMWEMFDANPQNLLSTDIAGIFRNSLFEIPAKLATIPPFLILVAPRHTRSQRSYRYIVPNRQITLATDIVQLVCSKCRKTNHNRDVCDDFYWCDICSNKNSASFTPLDTDAKILCYCTECLSKMHGGLAGEVSNHLARRVPVKNLKLNLFAVLCIETSHYVAFVKCRKREEQYEWLFFDSMSDRIHNEKNIPRVDRVPDFDEWINTAEKNQYFFEDLDRLRSQAGPSSQKFDENAMRRLRLFRDGAFFFYENSSVSYQ